MWLFMKKNINCILLVISISLFISCTSRTETSPEVSAKPQANVRLTSVLVNLKDIPYGFEYAAYEAFGNTKMQENNINSLMRNAKVTRPLEFVSKVMLRTNYKILADNKLMATDGEPNEISVFETTSLNVVIDHTQLNSMLNYSDFSIELTSENTQNTINTRIPIKKGETALLGGIIIKGEGRELKKEVLLFVSFL